MDNKQEDKSKRDVYSRWESMQCEDNQHSKCANSKIYPCECICHEAINRDSKQDRT